MRSRWWSVQQGLPTVTDVQVLVSILLRRTTGYSRLCVDVNGATVIRPQAAVGVGEHVRMLSR